MDWTKPSLYFSLPKCPSHFKLHFPVVQNPQGVCKILSHSVHIFTGFCSSGQVELKRLIQKPFHCSSLNQLPWRTEFCKSFGWWQRLSVQCVSVFEKMAACVIKLSFWWTKRKKKMNLVKWYNMNVLIQTTSTMVDVSIRTASLRSIFISKHDTNAKNTDVLKISSVSRKGHLNQDGC